MPVGPAVVLTREPADNAGLARALVAAGVSTLIAALCAVWYLRIRLDADTILLVDTTRELRALLEERASGGAATGLSEGGNRQTRL